VLVFRKEEVDAEGRSFIVFAGVEIEGCNFINPDSILRREDVEDVVAVDAVDVDGCGIGAIYG
jgi:hypothetical protein